MSDYIHGTAPDEQERLAKLNTLTNGPFIEWLAPQPRDRVLEVGSGLGLLAEAVAQQAGSIVGLEYSPAQLARAQTLKADNLSFVQGDAHQLPFPDASFDVVYCRYLLEHVQDPARVLAEMRRVLRSGGRICVQENNIEINRFDPPCPRFDHIWSRFAQLQARLGGDALIGLRLHRLVRAAGFVDITLSIAPEVHWYGSPGFESWVRNLIGNIRSGEKTLIETGLADAREITEAVAELEALMEREDASAIFYWNRAQARKF